MKAQKVVLIRRPGPGYDYLAAEGMGDSYLYSQCKGNAGIEKDLNNGWIVKHIWEDSYACTILLEHP